MMNLKKMSYEHEILFFYATFSGKLSDVNQEIKIAEQRVRAVNVKRVFDKNGAFTSK